MNTPKNLAIGLLALATVGGAILAWKQYGELVELRASALNREERSDLQKRIADLERKNREMQDRMAARTRRAEDGEAVAAEGSEGERRDGRGPGGPGSRGRPGDPRQMEAAMRELMAKPEVQAMMNLQQKAGIESRYAALFKNLNLTADQAEKLKSLLAERGNTLRDINEVARAQGIDPRENADAFRKLMTDSQNELNGSIKSVLGEQGYAALQTYEQTLPQRGVVEQLQRQLSHTDLPLNPSQAEQLVQILAANSPQRTTTTGTGSTTATNVAVDFGPGRGPGGPGGGMDGGRVLIGGPGMGMGPPGGLGGGTATVTPAAIAQAQTVLAGPQVAALQQIQQQQQTQQQLQQLIRDTLSASQPTTPTTGSGTGTGSPGTGGGPARKQRPGG
ncbi:MAG: hypothetical protein V4773_25100 [Verrucomicrobiota bacterium]